MLSAVGTAVAPRSPASAGETVAAQASAEAYLQTGWDRLNLGQFEAAADTFRQAVQLKPDLAARQLGLRLSLVNLYRYLEPVDCFEHAIALRPAGAQTFMNLESAHVHPVPHAYTRV